MGRTRYRSISERGDTYQVLEALKENRRKRAELGELFVEGIESIKRALEAPAFAPSTIIVKDRPGLSAWASGIVEGGLFEECIELSAELYDELADRAEPSELMATFRYSRLELRDVALPAKPFVIVFDRPSDRGNLGSLIRSANAFGADLFITHGHCVDFFEPKVIRSSLGAAFHTPLVHVESFDELAAFLTGLKRDSGLAVIGTDSGGSLALGDESLAPPLALVLGNEAKGMSVRLKALADGIVSIPMTGIVDSLNVACAGSILFCAIASARARELG